ncbi:hypothetical protein DOY81_009114 [Sarcophaga bullata]|nr:hypothetical protein DOY81_009114 [Sarcophaga bullata]
MVVSLCFIFYSTFVFIPGHMYSLIQYFMTTTTTTETVINTPLVKFEEIDL